MKLNLGLIFIAVALAHVLRQSLNPPSMKILNVTTRLRTPTPRQVPGWIEDANGWAEENNKDTKTFSYYSFETVPKVSRQIACDWPKQEQKRISLEK